MKIYSVSYIGMDDNTNNEYFSNKSKMNKRYNELKRLEKKGEANIQDDDQPTIKMVFSPNDFNCTISAKGILDMLNTHFIEQQ